MNSLFSKARPIVLRIAASLPWIGIVFVGLITVYSSWFLIAELPHKKVPPTVDEDQKRRLDLINSNRENILKVIQTIAGLGFVATAFIAWQNFKLTEDKNISERFCKAVEMLSSEDLNMRLGGIYSLERIAKDSKEDHAVVIEVLAAFVRDKARRKDVRKTESLDNSSTSPDVASADIDQDVQSALIVIGRRQVNYEGKYYSEKIMIDNVVLRRSDLQNINLENSRLNNVIFERSNLQKTKFKNTELIRSNFKEANLIFADFEGADLRYTDFEGADLRYCIFRGANLVGASFKNANLSNANLEKAILLDSDLDGANLNEASLNEARYLKIENLSKALICRTYLPKEIAIDSNRDCMAVHLNSRLENLYLLEGESLLSKDVKSKLAGISDDLHDCKIASNWLRENSYNLSEKATENLFTSEGSGLLQDFQENELIRSKSDIRARFSSDLISFLTWIAGYMEHGKTPKEFDLSKIFLDFKNDFYRMALEYILLEEVDPKVSGLTDNQANQIASYINRFLIDELLG